jgi:hypothetical protein
MPARACACEIYFYRKWGRRRLDSPPLFRMRCAPQTAAAAHAPVAHAPVAPASDASVPAAPALVITELIEAGVGSFPPPPSSPPPLPTPHSPTHHTPPPSHSPLCSHPNLIGACRGMDKCCGPSTPVVPQVPWEPAPPLVADLGGTPLRSIGLSTRVQDAEEEKAASVGSGNMKRRSMRCGCGAERVWGISKGGQLIQTRLFRSFINSPQHLPHGAHTVHVSAVEPRGIVGACWSGPIVAPAPRTIPPSG